MQSRLHNAATGLLSLGLPLIAIATLARETRAAVVYDAAGFEAPRFTIASGNLGLTSSPLAGQDAPPIGQGPWVQDAGSSTAVVQTNSTSSPLPGNAQAVRINRTAGATGDTRWHVAKPVTPTSELRAVSVSFLMNVNVSTVLGGGPSFGIEMYDASGSNAKQIGALLLQSGTGLIQYADSETGNLATVPNVALARNAYHALTLTADFANKEYSIYSGGTLLHTEDFVDETATMFSYAPLVTVDSATSTATATAYVDGYSISTVVPEPATAGLLLVGGVYALGRRRRSR